MGTRVALAFSLIDPGRQQAGTTTTAPKSPGAGPGSTTPVMHLVTASVPVGSLPNGVAVDSDTRTVYVTSYLDGTVSVIESR
ncbi:hypothetical protein [Mycobacterium gastri]|uniref:SMP-30/Gluconolactonase/LRE-like region domain-containing protein n=1 Tax=Mycobacterium gastri TaxID=1777 RepID=A0A1X1VXK9_MYCGS|nr:hypothetical protein [Mycobacterium gastri]ETW26098.1 hypothetical protein MGAST_29360 [Mycobacterium gastri 'Wayne']ORV74624.1 hypothetical protein AWC07_24945 [Mycobacterium gastri]